MLKKYPEFCFAFAIIFTAELIAIVSNLQEIRFLTKPLITVSLMAFVYFAIKRKSRFTNRIIMGLFFSLLGDIFLMFTHMGGHFFIMGLGSFLIAHLFYISAFYLDSTNETEVERRYILPIFITVSLFCMSFYLILRPNLGAMNIPVLVYSFTISLMVIMAALRYGKTNHTSFVSILIGATLFLVSDSILAYNKFVKPIEIGNVLIMSTYMLAQFLIAMGTVERNTSR